MSRHPLEADRARIERWIREIAGFVLEEIDELDHRPAVGPMGAAGVAVAREVAWAIDEAPLAGGSQAIATLLEKAAGASMLSNGPGYLAYIPGGGLPAAAVADFMANLLNRYTGVAAASPALCRLESDVLAWFAEAFGYPSDARGILTSGGSLANLSGVVTARHQRLGDDGDFSKAVAYTSSQAHHSVTKSMMLAGIPPRRVVEVPTDERQRLDPRALEALVRRDRERGLRPFLVVTAAGTTNTGAVDPLDAVADVCEALQLWHHVDGAYGGAFVLCEEGRRRLAGIERADSITFDPHKGMFLPYGTGCLLVRDGEALRRAHSVTAAYLQDFEVDGAPPSPSDYGPELSRDYRGLRVWLPLALHGAGPFRAALEEKLQLAEFFAERVRDMGLQLVDWPQLSVIAFRLPREPGESLERANERNRRWLAAINGRRRVYLSSTTLPSSEGPVVTLRACVLSFRTHAEHIERALADLRDARRDVD